MAATCFGPPPLPPNKKSTNWRHHRPNKPNLEPAHLHSTYRSFRDPADEPDLHILDANQIYNRNTENLQTITLKPNPLTSNPLKSHPLKSHPLKSHPLNSNPLKSNPLKSNPLKSHPLKSNPKDNPKQKCNLKSRSRFFWPVTTSSFGPSSFSDFGSLTRCQSDGNLEVRKRASAQVAPSMTINKCVKMLSGSWRNLINLGGMSRPPKPAAQVKKVAPPAVPHEFRHSGSSFGSAGYASSEDAGFLAATEPPRDDHSDYGSTVSGSTGKSPGPVFPAPTFTFPGQPPPGAVLTHKAAVYYHHQLSLQEDQGIDMTQSPGRDSPGSSSGSAGSGSRHSTASLDSGRASYHPLSNAGRSTIGSANSPRCSLSSCSIGSEQGRIERMIHQGVPDSEIIHAWLADLQFEEYFPLFVNAGYDLPTMCRMTPEDLTAVGIKKPNHRKRLKAEIAQLNLPDNLPDYIPGSLEEWLQLLRLEEYQHAFLEQGYHTVDDVAQLAWEDLEEFGVVKLGHQKKLMLAIKRIKDVRAGKRFNVVEMSRLHSQQDVVVHAPLGPPSPGLPAVHSTFRSFHQPWELDQTRQLAAGPHQHHHQYMQPIYCTDIVPIKVRTPRGKSLESLEDPTERTHHTFSAENTQTFYYQQPQPVPGWRPRSYDDGDITPTNESGLFYEGGGTLPRPRGVIRPRPVAKIVAKARDPYPEFDKLPVVAPQFGYYSPLMGKKVPPNPPKRQQHPLEQQLEQTPSEGADEVDGTSAGTTTTVEIHHHHHHHHHQHQHQLQTSSPLPLPAYPSSDSLSISLDGQGDLPLPPPPAPGTPPGSAAGQMNSSRSWGAEEQELINTLALQHRNGSDASFKSSSSTESDSLPFANENAGTIRTRSAGASGSARPPDYGPSKSRPGLPPHPSPTPPRQHQPQSRGPRSEPADVLNDIGNMLANLTDELDAMLEEEKRQQ